MSNDFYNADVLPVRRTLARSETIATILESIAAGFDKLPAELKLNQDRVTFLSDSGTANTHVVTMNPAPAAYVAGLSIRMLVNVTNTGAATLNVNGLGARSIKRIDGSDPAVGDLGAGDIVWLVYNGTIFVQMAPYRSHLLSVATAEAAAATAVAAAEDAVAAGTGGRAYHILGGTYETGDVAWSNTDEREYVALTDHTGVATDPAADATNWKRLVEGWLSKSTTYTAINGEKIAASVTGGAWTLTLPASPSTGDYITVAVTDGDVTANNLTIDGGAADVQGGATLVVDVALAQVTLVYNGTEWRIA